MPSPSRDQSSFVSAALPWLRGSASFALCLGALCFWGGFLGGCSDAPPEGFAAYSGDAFPNRRPRFDGVGRTLGYVANRLSDSVSVLDLDAMQELGTAPVGRDPADTDGPRHIALDEGRGLAYVLLTYPLEVQSPHVVMEGEAERASYVQALALDDLRPLGEARVDAGAEDFALSPSATSLVVSHRDLLKGLNRTPTNLVWLDEPWKIAQGAAVSRRLTTCIAPSAVAWSGESLVWVTCTGEDSLGLVEAKPSRVVGFVPSGDSFVNQPYALTANATGKRVLVSNQLPRNLVVFDLEQGADAGSELFARAVGTVAVPGIPGFAGFVGEDALIIPHREPSGVMRVNAESLLPESAILFEGDICENPSEALALQNGRLFVVCEGDHFSPGSVIELDPLSLAIGAKINVGVYPDRLAVRPPR